MIREQHGSAAFDLVEHIRRQSVGDFRAGAGDMALDRLLDGLSQPDMLLLIRAFSIFSQLANIADDHGLRRETRALGTGAAQRLEHQTGLSAKRVRAFLKDASFVPVVTAHPTEVRRKSVLDREIELGELLQQRDQASAQTAERTEIDAQLKRAIRILWQTRMLRSTRIQVADEIENNLAVFARTFLPQLPLLKRRLARLFGLEGEIMPFLGLGSWVGGDRDGNPNVSPETLDYAVRRQSEIVLDHYLAEIHALGAELSLSDSLVSTSEALKGWKPPPSMCPNTSRMSPIAAPWSRSMPAWRPRAARCWAAARSARPAMPSLMRRPAISPPTWKSSPPRCGTMANPTWPMAACSTCARRWRPSVSIWR